MSEQVVENVVENVESTETAVDRRPPVPQPVFDEFMQSGKTASMTQAEVAEALGMSQGSFSQRLNKYRKEITNLIQKSEKGELKVNGEVVKLDVKSLKSKLPTFKSAHRGRVAGQKQEFSATQRAVLAAAQGN